jgi:hypothetical protein
VADAICIFCGASKRRPADRCKECDGDPTTDVESLVKSVYLSTGRFESEDAQSQYSIELDDIGARLRRGIRVQYDANELKRLDEQRHAVQSVTRSQVWSAVLRFFLPGIIGLVLLWLLNVFLAWLNNRGG